MRQRRVTPYVGKSAKREGPRIVSIMDVTVGHESLSTATGGRKAA